MQKKILSIVIAIFTLCTCIFPLTACAENIIPHKHVYLDNYTCHDRKCQIEKCNHLEVATTEHISTKEYICENCKESLPCTLDIIAQDFGTEILEQAKINAGDMDGNFEIVVLDAQNTYENLQFYLTNPAIDSEKLVAGLFVKFEAILNGEILYTAYYNFGLQFIDEQSTDITFTFSGSTEIWLLEVVEGNRTILFEYSIVV